ncbi:hypothetical protein [Olleya sp. YS]|uniref:hypothetical protein n=1 Tax=Olleya sp. YS TaxID=3028318 RepID=UPI0024342122|nr:hypothetical protein [Olleya sp. YS]WGD33919.1 hypothetical protein Ollyesu_09020 [Olleya sp. YS]
MINRYYLLLLFCFISLFSIAQEDVDLDRFTKNNITKPNILSTHSFGVFFNRLQGHFEREAPNKNYINFSIESGNIWSPPVNVYIPKNEADRAIVRGYNWDQAHRAFDENTIDKDSFNLANDGVIKGFKAAVNIRLAEKHELQIGIRTYLLTKGKTPFSIFTNDTIIEDFHDNIAGGNDPFDRRVFGLNKANITYNDRAGNTVTIDAGDFFATGIEASYYYYPDFIKNKTIGVNFGGHLGANLSKSNSSLDFGVSANAIKTIGINDRNTFNLGLSLGSLRKGLVNFKSDNVMFGTNNFIGFLETALEYSFISKKGTIHTFGTDFYFQTSLNKKDELEYIIPIRNEMAFNSWGQGVTNLYKNNNYWTFIYSFGKKTTTFFYVQQDLTVNNNPDIQTGFGFRFNI